MYQMRVAVLPGPVAREVKRGTPGKRIQRSKIQRGAVLIRLAAVEGRTFKFQRAIAAGIENEPRRNYAVADVGGILQVMPERRGFHLAGRAAMQISHWAKSRLARRPTIKFPVHALAQGQ